MSTATSTLNVAIQTNADKATQSINAFTNATDKAAKYSGALEAAAKRAGISVEAMQTRVNAASKAANDNSKQVVAASNATRDFEKQAAKANTTANNFANTLTRRFLTGLAVAQIRSLTTELIKMNETLAITGDVAGRTGTDSGSLQGLAGAARNKGIGNTAFLDAYSSLGAQVEQAKHGAGDLLVLFRQTNSTLTTTEDAFLRISELVSQATSQTAKMNILQAAGLPATREFLRLMEQGPSAIRAQSENFSKFRDDQLKAAQELDDKFKQLGATLENGFKRAVVAAYDFFKKAKEYSDQYNAGLTNQKRIFTVGDESAGLDTSQTTGQVISAFDNRKAAKDAAERAAWEKTLNTQLQQRLSLLGELLSVDQQVKLKNAELNLAQLSGVQVSAQMRDAIIAETRLKAEATVASGKLQLGLASEKDIRLQVMAGLPPAVRALGEHTQAVQKNIEALDMQNQVAAAALPGLKQLELSSASIRTQLDTLGQGITNGISNPLVDLASGATRAGDAFKQMGLNIIRSIEQMIVNMTIAAPIARGLMSIFGGFVPGASPADPWAGLRGPVPSANGNVFSGRGISAFSSQIVDRPTIFPFAKGIGLMGEAGAEAIMPLTRIGGKLGVRAEGGSGGIRDVSISIGNITMPEDPNGNDPTGAIRSAAVAKTFQKTVENIIDARIVKHRGQGGMLNR